MPYRETTFKNRIVKTGIFDLDEVYNTVRNYLTKKKYDVEVKENTRKDKARGPEVIFKINAERKIDDYCKFHIRTDFLVTEANKINKKKEHGNLRLFFSAIIELDYRHNWEKTKFGKWLRDKIYHKVYFMRYKINSYYHGKLYGEAMELFNLIKEKLDLYS